MQVFHWASVACSSLVEKEEEEEEWDEVSESKIKMRRNLYCPHDRAPAVNEVNER